MVGGWCLWWCHMFTGWDLVWTVNQSTYTKLFHVFWTSSQHGKLRAIILLPWSLGLQRWMSQDFLGGPGVKNLPSNAEDTVRFLVRELRSHMQWGNWATMQLLSLSTLSPHALELPPQQKRSQRTMVIGPACRNKTPHAATKTPYSHKYIVFFLRWMSQPAMQELCFPFVI